MRFADLAPDRISSIAIARSRRVLEPQEVAERFAAPPPHSDTARRLACEDFEGYTDDLARRTHDTPAAKRFLIREVARLWKCRLPRYRKEVARGDVPRREPPALSAMFRKAYPFEDEIAIARAACASARPEEAARARPHA